MDRASCSSGLKQTEARPAKSAALRRGRGSCEWRTGERRLRETCGGAHRRSGRTEAAGFWRTADGGDGRLGASHWRRYSGGGEVSRTGGAASSQRRGPPCGVSLLRGTVTAAKRHGRRPAALCSASSLGAWAKEMSGEGGGGIIGAEDVSLACVPREVEAQPCSDLSSGSTRLGARRDDKGGPPVRGGKWKMGRRPKKAAQKRT
jgi:hypothetical protein